MEFEIMESSGQILFDVAPVEFPGYEEFRSKAADIAEQIGKMDVDPENIKEAKTTLAEARKITDRLSRARIDIKKQILEKYTVFEAQVKEISSIIGDAEDALRTKVRQLEEAERQLKKTRIREIWDKRINQCIWIPDHIPDAFDQWLTPQHLNKSMPMKKVEDDMKEWIRVKELDLEGADAMGEEYLVEYIKVGNLPEAVKNIKERETIRERIVDTDPDEIEETTALFLIKGTKNINFTEMLLKENEIEYERK